MSIDNKPDPMRPDESEDSVDSTPEREQTSSVAPAPGNTNSATQDGQQPKRKGGRKPVSDTTGHQPLSSSEHPHRAPLDKGQPFVLGLCIAKITCET